eukprot:132797_1
MTSIEYRSIDRKRHHITVFGSWNGFKGNEELEYCGRQIYTIILKLPIGIYHYRFLIDDEKWATNFFENTLIINTCKYNQIEVKQDQDPINEDNKLLKSKYDKLIKQKQKQYDQHRISTNYIQTHFNNHTVFRSKNQRIILLMSGYIRSVQSTLNNLIIPKSIITLCYKFCYDIDGSQIHIFCRIRPLLSFELKNGSKSCIQHKPYQNKISVSLQSNNEHKMYTFNFDKIYHPKTTQYAMFEDIESYINEPLHGENLSLFFYGQTGTGKTYTNVGPNDDRGILFNSLRYIFNKIHEKNGIQYTIKCAIFEVYYSQIRNLVHDDKQTKLKNDARIRVRMLPDGTVQMEGLPWFTIESENEFEILRKSALHYRSSIFTNVGAHSSRFPVLYSFDILGKDEMNDTEFHGKLHFIDCAGSERIGKYSAGKGHITKETTNINRVLRNVLESIQQNDKFIAYRDSVLTHLLYDSMGVKGSNSAVLFYLNVAPTEFYAEETVRTLSFGSRISSKNANVDAANKKGKKMFAD